MIILKYNWCRPSLADYDNFKRFKCGTTLNLVWLLRTIINKIQWHQCVGFYCLLLEFSSCLTASHFRSSPTLYAPPYPLFLCQTEPCSALSLPVWDPATICRFLLTPLSYIYCFWEWSMHTQWSPPPLTVALSLNVGERNVYNIANNFILVSHSLRVLATASECMPSLCTFVTI